jgi:ABC-2 type transport system permease protein
MQLAALTRKRYYNLVREFTFVQFRLRDQQTILGLIWSFLYPLVMMVLLFVMFDLRFAGDIDFFAVYLIIGLVHLSHFSNATSSCLHALPNSRQLVVNSTFPSEVLVISMVMANTIEFVISLLICVLIAYFAGVEIRPVVLWLPLIILMQTLLVMWVSLLLSSMCAFIADIGHIYELFLRMLIFITPVFFSLSFLGTGLALKLALINPLTHLMIFSRMLIIDGDPVPVQSILLFLVTNGLMVWFSLLVFRKMEPSFAEKL